MNERVATVIGGTGFLGRRVVRALAAEGYRVRVGARRPEAVDFGALQDRTGPFVVDIRDEDSVREAVTGASVVVNVTSLYVEKGKLTFEAIHVDGARRLARCARSAGVEQLIHVSGIGVDAGSPSRYVRARARGEDVVREAFDAAILVRPSVMMGCGDAFLQSLAMLTRLPMVPLFGRGDTRLQPVCVDDVASALVRLSEGGEWRGCVFELGGARVHTYREAVQTIMSVLDRRRVLLPVPFAFWHILTAALAILPNPPLTRDQIILMEADNVVGKDAKTFADLGIEPRTLASVAEECFARSTRK